MQWISWPKSVIHVTMESSPSILFPPQGRPPRENIIGIDYYVQLKTGLLSVIFFLQLSE